MSSLALRFDQIRTPRPSRALPGAEVLSEEWIDTSAGYWDLKRIELLVKLFDAVRIWADKSVDINVLRYAMAFLVLLPPETPEPDVVLEDDGEIAFDWDFARRSTFSVSIGPDGTLSYGGLFGHRTRYGSDQLTSSIPSEILALISETYSQQSS